MFARDGWRCLDCGRRYPDSYLEADHDIPVADREGDPNDPSNYVTRCLDDHRRKTDREARARAGRGGTMTTTVPKPPSPAAAWREAGAGLAGAGVAGAAAFPFYGPGALYAGLVAAGFAALATAKHRYRALRWARTVEAQRVYERLCKVTQDPAAARLDLMSVHAWWGDLPSDVTLRPGARFPGEDPAAVTRLRVAFAAALDADPREVHVERGPGTVRLTLTDEIHEPPAEPPPGQEEHRRDMEEALRPVLDDAAEVTVTRWHPAEDGAWRPASVTVAYPPRAASRAANARGPLLSIIEEHMPARNGTWRLRWDAPRRAFTLDDVVDVLAAPVPLPPIGDVDLAGGVSLGIIDDGDVFRLPLLTENGGTHVLVCGSSGAGKSSPLWLVIRQLAPMIADGRVRLWLADPKGGMEFTVAKPLAPGRFALTKPEIAGMLVAARDEMQAKARRLAAAGKDKLTEPTRENPLDVVLIDEVLGITRRGTMKREDHDEMLGAIEEMLTQGRAVGTTVIGASQKPQVDSLPFRDLFLTTLALRLNAAREVAMVLGQGARDQGALCDKIAPGSMAGTGYVMVDGQAGVRRFRCAFVPVPERVRIAGEYTPDVVLPRREPRGEGVDVYAFGSEGPVATIPRVVRVRDLTPGVTVTLDGDEVTVVDCEPDPDGEDGEDRWLLTYRGGGGEEVASVDGGTCATMG